MCHQQKNLDGEMKIRIHHSVLTMAKKLLKEI